MREKGNFEDSSPTEKEREEPERREEVSDEKTEVIPETGPLDLERLKREDVEETESVRREISRLPEQCVLSRVSPEGADEQQEKIKNYQENHLPPYLREPQDKENLIGRLGVFLTELFTKIEIPPGEKENLPEKGPFLVICNHFGEETPVLFSLLKDYDNHIAAGEELNWKRSMFQRWALRGMRMISVEESLMHLSPEEKEELLKRVPGKAQKEGYARVIEREEKGKVPTNIEFIRQSVALLSRGDVVVMYPEGLFLYEDSKGLHQGYQGVELINREYKRVTGKELTIVPVAVFEKDEDKRKKIKRVRVGKPILLSDNKTELSDTDWCMKNLAELLPEDQRGYYRETATQ